MRTVNRFPDERGKVMRRLLAVLLVLGVSQSGQAAGLLIPKEKKLPPLAMLNHQVSIHIEDQVAVTKIEQTFRNHTSNELEATYLFPVPKGSSEIGRASCRERVWTAGAAGVV